MAVSGIFAYSGTAASNTSVGGVSIAENCDMANMNNAQRAAMANVLNGIVSRGSDVASAATLDLDSATTPSLTHDITGTTTTTAITLTSGHWRMVRAVGAWPLTASASLIINGSTTVSYTCAADDVLIVEGFAAGVVRVWRISDGIKIGTVAATTSGTSIDFTSIPAGVRQITVSLSGVSTTGTSIPLIQLGDSGGVETSGYDGGVGINLAGTSAANANSTAGFQLPSGAASGTRSGSIVFTLLDPATNTWAAAGVVSDNANTAIAFIGGSKSLSATLDRVRLTTAGGTDTFDAGKMNIAYS